MFRNTRMIRFITLAGMLVTALLYRPVAHAQLPVGTISGVVRDSSGAVIPAASVTATNRETGLTRTTVTSDNGRFALPGLPVGSYDVKTEAPSFSSQVKQGLEVTIGQESVISFSLTVGSVAEAVTVTAEAPLVETTSGSLGGLVNEQKVSELPLNGRNFNELVLLQNGIAVHKQTSLTSSTGAGLVFSSNGAPIRSNYMTMDGANLASAEGLTGVSITGSMLGVEGIQEYRVITNSFPAEYGMTMGSQITVATKSGTNQWHGSVFEFLRNSALDARNFFDRKLHTTDPRIPAFRRNNFGGSVGGPIRHDRSFLFLTYEGNRESLGLTKNLSTITGPARQDGFFKTSGGADIPVSSIIKPYLALYPLPTEPLPTDPTGASGVGRFTYVFKQPTREDFGQTRIDQNFSESDTLFGRYTISDTSQTDSAENWPMFPRLGSSRGQFATVAENHTITPVLLNLFRFSYSRTFGRYDSPTIQDPNLEFLPGKGLGGLSISGGVTGLGPSTPWILFNQNLFTMSDDQYWSHGSHSVKYGVLGNRYQVFMEPSTSWRGSYSFANLSSFLQGITRQFSSMTPGSNPYRVYRWYTWGFYLQDDWRVTSKLTLNVGLRYEFNTTVNEHSGHGSHLEDLLHDRDFVVTPALSEDNSYKNFGPRLGFAWDPHGDTKMALRGGFALLYDVANMAGAAQINATASPPFSSMSTITTPAFTVPFPKPGEIPEAARGKSIRIADFHLQQPHMIHYNLTVERQLPADLSISMAYVATRGINLYQTKEGNPTVPGGIPSNGSCVARPAGQSYVPDGPKCWLGTEQRLNTNWASTEFKTSAGDSWYNGLQIGIQRRLSHGLQLQSSYTWSKALDTTQGQKGGESGGAGNTGVDPDNPAVDKGSSDFDTRHSWTVNGLYRLPAFGSDGMASYLLSGWRLGSIFSVKSGLPFTPSLSGNRSRSQVGAGNADRPDLVPGRKPEDIILGGPDRYFDPAAFSIQPLGFLGTASRNFLQGPGQVNLDFSLTKEFGVGFLTEGTRADLRFEVFNVLNHPNFNIPVAGRTVYTANETSATLTPNSTAGNIDRTRSDARKIQFGLKVTF